MFLLTVIHRITHRILLGGIRKKVNYFSAKRDKVYNYLK